MCCDVWSTPGSLQFDSRRKSSERWLQLLDEPSLKTKQVGKFCWAKNMHRVHFSTGGGLCAVQMGSRFQGKISALSSVWCVWGEGGGRGKGESRTEVLLQPWVNKINHNSVFCFSSIVICQRIFTFSYFSPHKHPQMWRG